MHVLSSLRRFNQYLKIKCVIIYGSFINLLLKSLTLIVYRTHRNPRKILVFRTGSIGDSICAMPAISNLRNYFPDSNIHLLTNAGKGHRNLVSIEAMIEVGVFDEILNYENLSRKELVVKLRGNSYDLIVQLPQYGSGFFRLIRDILFFRYMASIRSGFGWQCDNVPFFKKVQEKYLRHLDERSRLNDILHKNGIAVRGENQFPFQIVMEDRSKISDLIKNITLSDKPFIALVPGAKRPQNRWPLTYFSVIIQHFSLNYNIILLGGPDDESLVEPLLIFQNTYSLCGQLSPVQSGLLMQHCKVVLSNDTGPMHLAYAFGTPVVALFSNRDFPYRWFPPDNDHNVTFRATEIPCSICLSENCMDNICMKKITPLEVIDQIESLLQSIANKS